MRVRRDNDPVGERELSVITVGVFDGVHRGHQALLARVVEIGRREHLVPTVVTFHPHPARVLDPTHAPSQLESLERRLARFAQLGIAQVRVLTFDESTARETPDEFVQRVIVGDLAARRVIVGADFRFGHDRSGDVASLRLLGERDGFAVEGIDLVGQHDRYSSTAARALVQRGDLVGAEAILGHHVVISGEVIHGDARGGIDLGFPTANLALVADVVQPGGGIYAGAARVPSGEWFPAAISVGRRPQFYAHGELLVEAHLVGYEGTLYGEWIDVVFLTFLRGEAKFDTTADLITQIGHDVDETREIYKSFSGNPDSLLGFSLGQRR